MRVSSRPYCDKFMDISPAVAFSCCYWSGSALESEKVKRKTKSAWQEEEGESEVLLLL